MIFFQWVDFIGTIQRPLSILFINLLNTHKHKGHYIYKLIQETRYTQIIQNRRRNHEQLQEYKSNPLNTHIILKVLFSNSATLLFEIILKSCRNVINIGKSYEVLVRNTHFDSNVKKKNFSFSLECFSTSSWRAPVTQTLRGPGQMSWYLLVKNSQRNGQYK